MPCHYYPPADLDDLEEEAETATPEQQRSGLQIVADIFNAAGLPYALMGGMNFYLRGSGRTTQDVDLAVSGAVQLEAILNLLNNDERITRPANRMSWLSGVARIFVRIGTQQVQLDLKWQRAEGHGMPPDLNAASEALELTRNHSVRFLSIGPLVKAKFQSYGRGFDGDFTDLLFVCTHRSYGRRVREVADEIRMAKRVAFLEETLDNHPNDEAAVRYALKLDRGSSPESDGSGGKGTRSSPGGTGGSGGSNGGRTSKTAAPSSRTQQSSTSTGSRTSSQPTGTNTSSRTAPSAASSLVSGMRRMAVSDSRTSRSSTSTSTSQPTKSSRSSTTRTTVSGRRDRDEY